jgi:hypothetical protein
MHGRMSCPQSSRGIRHLAVSRTVSIGVASCEATPSAASIWSNAVSGRTLWAAPSAFATLGAPLFAFANKFPGGHRRGVTPVPIPNTEVKPFTADGTARVALWESRSLPGINPKARIVSKTVRAFFFFAIFTTLCASRNDSNRLKESCEVGRRSDRSSRRPFEFQ